MNTAVMPGRHVRAPDELLPATVRKVLQIDGWPGDRRRLASTTPACLLIKPKTGLY